MPLPTEMTFEQVAALADRLAAGNFPVEESLARLQSDKSITTRASLHLLAGIVARQSDEIASLRRQLERVQSDNLPIGPISGYVSPLIIGGGIGE